MQHIEGGGDGWARFRVVGVKQCPMDRGGQWRRVPPLLEGAQVFQFTEFQPNRSNKLEFEVLEDGPIVLGAHWGYVLKRSPKWLDGHTSAAGMVAQGWEPIGVGRRSTAGTADQQFVFFRKVVRRGEKYTLHTGPSVSPVLVVPAKAQQVAVLKANVLYEDGAAEMQVARGSRREVPAPTPPQLLLLDTYELTTGGNYNYRGLLGREIVRQAVLLAGREELGLQTRDATLGEQFPDTAAKSNQLLGVVSNVGLDGGVALTLFRGPIDNPDILWRRAEILREGDLLENLVTALEAHTRNSLPQVLRDSGFEGQAHALHESAPVDEAIERQLQQMNFTEQFRAARSLHKLIRSEGASPERLSALARAYANLGLLTEVHWNAAQAAFKARSLLYAQRMLTRWPQSPLSFWTRGYARTAAGCHATGLADFGRAEMMRTGNPKTPRPTWAHWALAACRSTSELNTVDAAAEGSALARLLALVQLEQFGDVITTHNAVERVLETSPDCFRAVEVMAGIGSLGTRNSAARMGPHLVNHHLYQRLERWSDLPEPVTQLIRTRDRSEPGQEQAVRIELIDALHAAGQPAQDRAELSFSALASLLEELSFLHVRREVQLLKDMYAVPADELRQQREPLVRNPAYRWYLQLYADQPAAVREALKPLADTVDQVNLSWWGMELVDKTSRAGDDTLYSRLFTAVEAHLDPVLSDLWFAMRRKPSNDVTEYYPAFIKICPHVPVAICATIVFDGEKIDQQRAEALRRRYWDVAPVVKELAAKHLRDQDWDQAEQLLKRNIELAPDFDGYVRLADVYGRQNDFDRWKATLDEFITTQPSPGLQHASARVRIANALMERRRWQEALPYAEQSARSGASWALLAAAAAHEALQDWQQAEAYYQADSLRYLNSGANWYYFCRRTGQGDLAGARAAAMQFAERAHEANRGGYSIHLMLLAMLEGDQKKASTHAQESVKAGRSPLTLLYAALVAHESPDREARDKYLDDLIRKAPRYSPNGNPRPHLALAAFGKLLKAKLSVPGPVVFTDDEIAEVLKEGDDEQQVNVIYVAGRLLELAGRKEQATEYYKRCMAYSNMDYFTRTLAGHRLVQLNVPAESYREPVQGQQAQE